MTGLHHLSPEQWSRVKLVFDAAVALDATERAALLERDCGGDAALRQHVETLLESHQRSPDFLETPAAILLDRPSSSDDLIGRTIGPYRLVARIGAGGMGEVYKADDSKLDRTVALKLLAKSLATDADRLRRFHAEARAASSLNHPQILVIHDFGEVDGRPFIVTEFVEGQTLRERMKTGGIPVSEALEISIQVAGALAAAHARGLVHRDIKPENVMVRPDGYVKVLDFGLAKLMTPAAIESVSETHPGTVMGTPRYMSPEQARGLDVDARTDIWSLGVMLYEMLAGRPPFDGPTPSDVMAAVLRSDPLMSEPGLGHVPASVSAVAEQALAKEAGLRFASASDMHKALTAARASLDSAGFQTMTSPTTTRPTRLIVLPFRVLRPDADTGFLAFSLPDAITASLAGLQSLLVRPSITAARFASDEPDVAKIASEADVDVVLSGTLLRSGDEIRVTTQLVDASAGTVILSSTLQAPVGDLFRLQDELTSRIVESLALPLTTRERRQLRHDVPATAKAYDYYLRANQAGLESKGWPVARDLYLQAVEEDPKFAPAWARLARVYRLLGKYGADQAESYLERAEAALRKALALNPDLPMAHNLYAQLDADRGRAEDAMVRLLARAKTHGADPEIYAGLVHACRYCGLLEASLAAHHLAARLDANQATSVMQTYFVMGRYEEVLRARGLVKGYVSMLSLVALGRNDDAVATVAQIDQARIGPRGTGLILSVKALAEGDRSSSSELLSRAAGDLPDSEGLFHVARHLAYLGDARLALDTLARAIDAGYFAYTTLADSWFDSIRSEPEFQRLLDRAREGHESALNAFRASGGPVILGLNEAKAPESDGSDKRLGLAGDVRSIAVLPFTALDLGDSESYLGPGLADAVITKLTSIRRIAVRPTSAILKYGGPDVDAAAAGRALRVESVLSGTIQKLGDRIRVTTQLVDVEQEAALWGEAFDQPFTDIFQLEDSISEKVASALMFKVTSEERRLLAKHHTDNPEAYRWILRGRYFWNKGAGDWFPKAFESFQQAIAADPNDAVAHAGLADCFNMLGFWGNVPSTQAFPSAEASATTALGLDESLPDAHAALAWAKVHYHYDRAGAERAFIRSLELNPSSIVTLQWWALFLAQEARFDDALEVMRRAHELDPLFLHTNYNLGVVLMLARRDDEAIAQFQKTIELDPGYLMAHSHLGFTCGLKGQREPAMAAQAQVALMAKDVLGLRITGWALLAAMFGERDTARASLAEAVELAKSVLVFPTAIAQIHAQLSDNDAAMVLLERAYVERDPWLVWLKVNPCFDPIRDDPRFADLMTRVGLPVEPIARSGP